MADFSSSGLEALGLPAQTLESLERGGDPRVSGWVREAVQEGDRINRSDPSYDRMEQGMRYVEGEQRPIYENAQQQPGYVSGITINESRRVVQSHASALTDIKPLFAYKATNPAFTFQADLLNKLTVAWWITSMADLSLGDVIKYSLSAGTGDMVTEWNPHARFGGDISIAARDARDTLPIRPSPRARSVQEWEGLVLRESHTINALRGLFPDQASKFRATTDSLLSTLMGRFRRMASSLLSPSNDTLSGLNQPAAS